MTCVPMTTVDMASSLADCDSARLDDDGAPIWPAPQPPIPQVRLAWAPSQSSQPVGAWWPRSRDATVELRALLPEVSCRLGGSVTRVSLNIDAWAADQPRRLRVGDRLLRLGWFHTLDRTTVTLRRGSDPRITLLVLPPELDPKAARKSLREMSSRAA
jgi:hypothetical protein